jgi:serine/threonine protein kinase
VKLSHPNLLRVYDAGVVQLHGRNLLWVLMQFADRICVQIVPLRALTPSETEQMIAPVLSAISYLHRDGFIHGRIKPSNIMAIGDQIKLSADSLSIPGDPLIHSQRTPYEAPEVRQAKSVPASDMWFSRSDSGRRSGAEFTFARQRSSQNPRLDPGALFHHG